MESAAERLDFTPVPDSKLGELSANFVIVVGRTVDEDEDGRIKGGIGPSERSTGGGSGPPRG